LLPLRRDAFALARETTGEGVDQPRTQTAAVGLRAGFGLRLRLD